MPFVIKTALIIYPVLAVLALTCLKLSKRKDKKVAFYLASAIWFSVSLLLCTAWLPLINVNDMINKSIYETTEMILGGITLLSSIGYILADKDWPKFALVTVCGIILFFALFIVLPLLPALLDILDLLSQVSFASIVVFITLLTSQVIFAACMLICLNNIDRWIIKNYKKQS